MRLFRRTISDVRIYPRVLRTGALGGAGEEFSDAAIAEKASIGYVNNALNSNLNALSSAPYGVRIAQAINQPR